MDEHLLLQSKKVVDFGHKWELYFTPRCWTLVASVFWGTHVIGIRLLCFDLAIRRTKNGK